VTDNADRLLQNYIQDWRTILTKRYIYASSAIIFRSIDIASLRPVNFPTDPR